MKGFLYCFRLEIAVVGAYLWENCVRKKTVITFTVALCMLNAHCFLILHSMSVLKNVVLNWWIWIFLSETTFDFYCYKQVNDSIFGETVGTLWDFLSVITVYDLYAFPQDQFVQQM